jgi:hypothetical protein
MVLALAACSGSNGELSDAAAAADADVCAAGPPYTVPDDCVAGGLSIDLNGTWTFTGTQVRDPGTPWSMTTQVTGTITLRREGTGWCVFGTSGNGETPTLDKRWYIDDNYASYYQIAIGARIPDISRQLCRRTSDQALYLTHEEWGFQSNVQYHLTRDVVLTR